MADDTASHRPQPVLYSQLVTVLTAVLGLLAAFGLDLTDDQRNAILGTVSAVVPLIALAAAAWARSKVTPLADPRDDQGRRLVAAGATETPAPTVTGDDPPVIAPPGGPVTPAPATERGRRARDSRGRWTD